MNKITTVALREQRVSPKKARLIMNLIRNKPVEAARNTLLNADKKTAKLALNLLKSAIDSAKAKNFKEEDLFISESIAQEGKKMKRFYIRARGRSAKFQHKQSHLKISLAKIEVKGKQKDTNNSKKDQKKVEKNG
ncbi:MAG: uL22 family ribosomal protein [bacterium]